MAWIIFLMFHTCINHINYKQEVAYQYDYLIPMGKG